MVLLPNTRVAFIGLGKMASYMLQPLLEKNILPAANVIATRTSEATLKRSEKRFPGIRTTLNNVEAIRDADVIFYGIKPQDFFEVTAPLKGSFKPTSVIVSMLAGTSFDQLTQGFGHAAIVRTMPNVPVALAQGMLPFACSDSVTEAQKKLVMPMLDAMGKCLELQKESQIDMATAISGSSPAYFLLMLESLVEAGVHIGLKRDVAFELAQQSMLGTANMAAAYDGQLAPLKYSVTSPGGITASALYQAEKSGLRHTISEMVWAAYRRSLEISDDEDKHKVIGPGYWEPKQLQ